MSANAMEIGILEKLGDAFARFVDGFTKLISRIFGYSADWQVKEIGYTATRNPEKPFVVSRRLSARSHQCERNADAGSV